MFRSFSRAGAISLAGLLPLYALAGQTPLTTQLVTNQVSSPIDIASPPGDPTRLFVVERVGRVRLIKNGQLMPTPFLNITSQVSTDIERGLLGMDFHPNYAANGQVFVRYNNLVGETTVMRYTVSSNPDVANPASAAMVFELPQSTAYHNGGSIEFGPEGYLYITTGEGGAPANAQNLNSFLGKILRLDVNGDDFPSDNTRNYRIPPGNPFINQPGLDEIWAYGLRNPFRASFDRATGDYWIGDVGQNTYEEVDFQPPGQAARNYGWPCMEGPICTSNGGCACPSSALTPPIFHYLHFDFGCAITGGRVYRGCAIPDLQGTYFCADYCTDRIFSFRYVNGSLTNWQLRDAELNPPGSLTIDSIVAFGEDYYGELYICDLGGEVFKIVPAVAPPDANNNGVPDTCEGSSPGDVNGDGIVNVIDLLAVIGAWGPCPPLCPPDIAPPGGDGVVNVNDLLMLIGNWS